jgi:hypothetical protein
MSGIFLKSLDSEEATHEKDPVIPKVSRRMSAIFLKDLPSPDPKDPKGTKTVTTSEIPIVNAAFYDGGFVSSNKLGDLTIQGSVFFVLPSGKLPRIETEKLPAAQAWLNEEAKGVLDGNPTFRDKFQNIAENAFYLAPGLQWPSQKMKTFLKANAFLWSLDDYCDNACIRGIEILERKLIFEVGNVVADILLGQYDRVEDVCLERLGEAFDPLLRLMFSVYKEVRGMVRNDYKVKARGMADSWRNLVLHSLAHVAPTGKMWECDELHMAIRAQSGVIPIVELILLMEDVQVSPDVRKLVNFSNIAIEH